MVKSRLFIWNIDHLWILPLCFSVDEADFCSRSTHLLNRPAILCPRYIIWIQIPSPRGNTCADFMQSPTPPYQVPAFLTSFTLRVRVPQWTQSRSILLPPVHMTNTMLHGHMSCILYALFGGRLADVFQRHFMLNFGACEGGGGGGCHVVHYQHHIKDKQPLRVKEASGGQACAWTWGWKGWNKTSISVTMATGELELIHTLKLRASNNKHPPYKYANQAYPHLWVGSGEGWWQTTHPWMWIYTLNRWIETIARSMFWSVVHVNAISCGRHAPKA